MISKIKNFVQLVIGIPHMIRAAWWAQKNKQDIQTIGEEIHSCPDCNIHDTTNYEDMLCDEHKEMMEDLGGPF